MKVALILITTFVSAAAAQSIESIRDDLANARYQPALAAIGKALKISTIDAQLRYELFMLRGEALLQTRQKGAAIEAFESASAAADELTDIHPNLAALAMVNLLRGSEALTYRLADGSSADLLAAGQRASVMNELFNDRLNKLKDSIDRAARADALGPTIALLPDLNGLMALEFGATGDVAKTKGVLSELGEHARVLITRELNLIDARVNTLQQAAQQFQTVDTSFYLIRRGLHSDELNEARASVVYLKKIQSAAEDGRRIGQRLGDMVDAWDSILISIGELSGRLESLIAENAPRTGK